MRPHGEGVGNRDPTHVEGQVGRLIGRGFPRESGILAGTWFYRDPVTLDCREEPEVFKNCFPPCTHGARKARKNTVGASWYHQALGSV